METAQIYLFPSLRRHGLPERIAGRGEKYVRHFLEGHRARLERIGIAPAQTESDIADLEKEFERLRARSAA